MFGVGSIGLLGVGSTGVCSVELVAPGIWCWSWWHWVFGVGNVWSLHKFVNISNVLITFDNLPVVGSVVVK